MALTGASQGWSCWFIALTGGLCGAVLVLTFAPWAPLLHALPPPVGAPKVRITFKQLEASEKKFGKGLLLEVGVRPTTRLDDAVVNFQYPIGPFPHEHAVRVVDPNSPWEDARGTYLPPLDLIAPTDSPIRWWASEEDIRAASRIYYVVLQPAEPQAFTVTMLVTSEKLYKGSASASYEVRWP